MTPNPILHGSPLLRRFKVTIGNLQTPLKLIYKRNCASRVWCTPWSIFWHKYTLKEKGERDTMHLFMKSCVSPSSACLISAPPSPLHFLTSTLSLFYSKLFHLHLWPHPAVSGICCINFRKTSEAETWSRPPGDLVTAQASSVFWWWYLTNNNPSHSVHGPCANSCSSLISFPASNTQWLWSFTKGETRTQEVMRDDVEDFWPLHQVIGPN